MLSEKEILKTTAFALNETLKKTKPQIKKEIRAGYTIGRKYQDGMSEVTKKAKATQSGLYSELSLKNAPFPMVGFTYTDKKPKNWRKGMPGGVEVQIKKGKPEILKHAFTATMPNGHTGIFQRGSYKSGKFVPGNVKMVTGKRKITELKTASPFGMFNNKDVQARITQTIKSQLPGRVKALLQQKIDKKK